jgi:hypothetical protein
MDSEAPDNEPDVNDVYGGNGGPYRVELKDGDRFRLMPVTPRSRGLGYAQNGEPFSVSRSLLMDRSQFHFIESRPPEND